LQSFFFFWLGLGLPRQLFVLFALISTGVGSLFVISIEPWFVMTCSVNFGARVDQFIGDGSVEFNDLHPFSATQSTGGFTKGFDN
jgi:peroxiredoxin